MTLTHLLTVRGRSAPALAVPSATWPRAHEFDARRKSNSRLVLAIGTSEEAALYVDSSKGRLELVGVLSDDETGALYLNAERIVKGKSPEAMFADVLRSSPIDEVFIASPLSSLSPAAVAQTCAVQGIIVRTLVKLPVLEFGEYRARVLGRGTYLLSLETVPHAWLALLVKRAIDITGALVGLVLCAVVYCRYARRIRAESRASVFFRQRRVGTNGRTFTLYKFRTMSADAEQRLAELLYRNEMNGCVFKMRDDPRITPIGRRLRRHYLDELPQFFNVLRGDMSLVGPRPPTPDEVARYLPYQRRRLSMKGGLAGLWQTAGNGKVKHFDEIVALDCEYIDNWSLWLDLKILAKTVLKALRGDGW